MDNTFKFGLSDSLISSVREVMEAKMKGVCPKCGKSPCQCGGDVKKVEEALKSGQKKLDKNHNGKLDKQDFKMLRKEEAEELDELSDALKKRYIKKADKQVEKASNVVFGGGPDGKRYTKAVNTYHNRLDGIKKAKSTMSNEEVEAIDERDMGNKAKKNAAVAAVGAKNKDSQYLDRMNPAVADKIRGREKMSGKDRQQFEEVEQLDELSPKTLYSYGSKAHNQVIKTGMGLTKKQGGLRTKGVSLEDGKRKMANRKAGVELAHKKAQAKTNEEVDFSEAEIARINEILKDL